MSTGGTSGQLHVTGHAPQVYAFLVCVGVGWGGGGSGGGYRSTLGVILQDFILRQSL